MTTNQSNGVSAEFGYYPKPIEIENERFSIKTLPNFQEIMEIVKKDTSVHKGWKYSEKQQSIDMFNDEITILPFCIRTFDMPKTHILSLYKSDNINDLDFVVWCLSFFSGMRLSILENGFLDATPLEPDRLFDFVLQSSSFSDVIELALEFLISEKCNTLAIKQVKSVIHTLFLAQYPNILAFEKFNYLYIALDTCYRLVHSKLNLKKDIPHKGRIEWLCEQFNIPIPNWAIVIENQSEISKVRNKTMHEGLFFDEPLGFSIYGGNEYIQNQGNIPIQMQNLVCRLLIAILGRSKIQYIQTPVVIRLQQSLKLNEI